MILALEAKRSYKYSYTSLDTKTPETVETWQKLTIPHVEAAAHSARSTHDQSGTYGDWQKTEPDARRDGQSPCWD